MAGLQARLYFCGIWMYPRAAIRTSEAAGGFGVVGNGARLWVVGERTAKFLGDIGESTTCGGDVAFLHVSDGTRTIFPRLHEVFHVALFGFHIGVSVLAEIDI